MKIDDVTVGPFAAMPDPTSSSKPAVVLFGEALVDMFPHLRVWGGAPLNVARHLHAFGEHSILITCLGLDPLGDDLFQFITDSGMQTSGIQRTDQYPTGRVEIDDIEGTHRFTILPDQAYDHIDGETARSVLRSSSPALMYFGSLAQRNAESRNTLLSLLEDGDAVKFFDINLRTPWYEKGILEHSLHNTDILKLNSDELDLIAEMFGLPDRQTEGRLEALINNYQLSHIVLTRGEKGSWLMNGDGRLYEIGMTTVSGAVVDTVGAGDAFSAVVILGIMRGWPLRQSLEKANEFAAAICSIRGALPVDRRFYQQNRKAWTD